MRSVTPPHLSDQCSRSDEARKCLAQSQGPSSSSSSTKKPIVGWVNEAKAGRDDKFFRYHSAAHFHVDGSAELLRQWCLGSFISLL